MKRHIKKDLKTLYVAGIAGICLFSAMTQAADNSPAINALLQQAAYWHDKAHNDLAEESLQKILAVDENNADALYLLSLYSLGDGQKAQAQKWRQRFVNVSPNDPRLQNLNSASVMQSISPTQLANARQLAAQGNTARAIESYRTLFQNNQPPVSLAVEYYETLAGIPASRPEAIAGLRNRLNQQPTDSAAKLALGRILTYDENTRREGIELLMPLARNNKAADSALRQALIWMASQPGDKAIYDAYMQRHPGDDAVLNHFQQSVGGAEKGQGYTALNSGDLSAARTKFESALVINPNDGDALAGLGYIAMRSGDFSTAENFLDQAMKQGGPNSTQWASLAKEAQFYGQLNKAKSAASAGDLNTALSLSEPLAQAGGSKGISAELFRADVLRRRGDLPGAEQAYRTALSHDDQNTDTKLGLYYTLHQENKEAEAQQVLTTIPAEKRPKIAMAVAAVNVDPLRRQAEQAMQANDPQRALNVLQQALAKQPANVWVRLDMARILQKQGDSAQAQAMMASAGQRGAPADSLFAAALFASETQRWSVASQLLSYIPNNRRTRAMRDLTARVSFNEQLANAQRYTQQGNHTAALNTLRSLAQTPPSAPADVGKLAQALMALGDSATAVSLVRNNMRAGVNGNAGDYAAQVAVLNQAGLTTEAEAWLNNPRILASTTPAELSRIRQGSVINQADELRGRGQYGAAYDKLIVAMQNDPQNIDLMLAMARLYQSGKMNDQAARVYHYVLVRDPQNESAREGAANVALAQGDIAGAKQLVAGMRGARSVDRMVLEARIAEASGDHQQALALLRSAKGRVIGLSPAGNGGAPLIGGLQTADNPFINQSDATTTPRTTSSYGTVLPWQHSDSVTPLPLTGMTLASTHAETPEDRTLKNINQLIDQVRDKTATWVQGDIGFRSRDGESGLSNLSEIKAPLTISGAPFDSTRLKLSVTPVSLNAGTPTGSVSNRFGTGALQQARLVEAATTAANAAAVAGSSTSTTTTSTTTNADGTSSSTTTTTESATSAASTINADDYVADSPGSQTASGVELNLSLSGNSYQADVGTTPLGEDLSSLVGGIQWSPSLTHYSKLIFTAERRAVTDSLLSYVGTTDKISGNKWGQVTKNGGGVQYSYDNGDAGLYAGIAGYSYLGDNVPANTGINSSVGFYVRPYRDDHSEVKTGVNVTFMDYDKNLSYYSYGQGGYFSPQNYISISLPVDYSQTYDEWTLAIGGAAGYQSYSQDKSAYFPNNPTLQAQLESLVASGYGKNAYYDSRSENGVSYNVHANGTYKINPNMSVGGQLGYDTFGSYSESTALLYFKYLLGEK
ncbi:cellulose synthase subunit BcsC-related outer membrane protein [Acerihabitans sp. TG2]|uniref:cellulose biosynthesis protein BcsC n=1 Tax=Acerihabitans sp. TG2 TaxID=3096008 RepID=UPI002B23825F|nr:cellulose synthase subunit BcsC-related outer membrane protein [Acerihabitans sp. TG2]MEA9389915.1 cellulose synthase subunit BcsC-related outer membrane protein [Acerihabitans sp. TG2]